MKPVITYRTQPQNIDNRAGERRLADRVFATGEISPDHMEPLSVLGIDGSGIFNGAFIADEHDAVAAISGITVDALPALGARMRGSLTLYLFDSKRRETFVMTDPLGGSLTFVARQPGFAAVSTYVEALASTVSRHGFRSRKSLAYAMSQLATGMYGGIIDSSYDLISALEPGKYLKITSSGISEHSYPVEDVGQYSWEEGVERARDEIIQNVRIAAHHRSARHLAHLTGGLDSRMVLGAIMAAGLKDAFAFNTRGPSSSADRLVAEKLASEYDLTMTAFLGLNEAVPPVTRDAYLVAPLEHTGGIAVTPALPDMYHDTALTLSGGYGEIYRSYASPSDSFDGNETPARAAAKKWGSYAFSEDSREVLFTDQVVRGFLSPIADSLDRAAARNLDPGAWLDIFYRRYRNRYFVGEISRAWSRFAPRFDPLYSVFASEFTLTLSGVERSAGLFQFDVMRSFDEKLPFLPYDSPRFNTSYLALRGNPRLASFEQSGSPRVNDWTNRKPLVDDRRYNDAHELTSADRRMATGGLSPIQVASVRAARTTIERLAESVLSEGDVVKPQLLEKLKARALHHEWSRRALLTVERALRWVSTE